MSHRLRRSRFPCGVLVREEGIGGSSGCSGHLRLEHNMQTRLLCYRKRLLRDHVPVIPMTLLMSVYWPVSVKTAVTLTPGTLALTMTVPGTDGSV